MLRSCGLVVAWLPRVYPVCIRCIWRGCRMVVAMLPHGCRMVALWLPRSCAAGFGGGFPETSNEMASLSVECGLQGLATPDLALARLGEEFEQVLAAELEDCLNVVANKALLHQRSPGAVVPRLEAVFVDPRP